MATLFRENGIEVQKVNYFNEPFTAEKIADLVKKTGLRPIKMTRGAAAAGLTDETPDTDVIKAMAADPNLIQRPIVEVGDKAVVARPIEAALELLGI
ncbi:MAG: ArsC family protein [Acidobacteria bacterium OLB17]|nr:MAG: ArsC family protein [Acidobacteria bacterium OLB17]MCZ2391395.1 arsenate reductase [Acidobacteriota bacterium]